MVDHLLSKLSCINLNIIMATSLLLFCVFGSYIMFGCSLSAQPRSFSLSRHVSCFNLLVLVWCDQISEFCHLFMVVISWKIRVISAFEVPSALHNKYAKTPI